MDSVEREEKFLKKLKMLSQLTNEEKARRTKRYIAKDRREKGYDAFKSRHRLMDERQMLTELRDELASEENKYGIE